jgi:hypothetical protein
MRQVRVDNFLKRIRNFSTKNQTSKLQITTEGNRRNNMRGAEPVSCQRVRTLDKSAEVLEEREEIAYQMALQWNSKTSPETIPPPAASS